MAPGLGGPPHAWPAEHGADLVLAGRRPEPLAQTAETIRGLDRRALVVPTDVTDESVCEALVAAALSEFGRVDILVNNAGGSIDKPPEKWTGAEWYEIVNQNLSGAWFMSRLVAAPMIEQGRGAIVNISSGASFLALPNVAPYGAAKAGLNSLTRSLAAAWTAKGVRVNAVACGAVQTEGYGRSTARAGIADDALLGPGNAIGRIGQPDEIAYPVLFFASDAFELLLGPDPLGQRGSARASRHLRTRRPPAGDSDGPVSGWSTTPRPRPGRGRPRPPAPGAASPWGSAAAVCAGTHPEGRDR